MPPPSLTARQSAAFSRFIGDLKTLVDSPEARGTLCEEFEGWLEGAETVLEPYRDTTTRLSIDDLQESVTENSLFGASARDKRLGHQSFYESCVEDRGIEEEVARDLEKLWNQYWALILTVRGREVARGQAQASERTKQRARLAGERSGSFRVAPRRANCANWPQRGERSVAHQDE
jgi:hypothetical protein